MELPLFPKHRLQYCVAASRKLQHDRGLRHRVSGLTYLVSTADFPTSSCSLVHQLPPLELCRTAREASVVGDWITPRRRDAV